MKQIVDLSHPIASGIPAWVEMAGTFGLAKTLVSTWEDYEETAYLRTHGKVKELYRTTLVVMSDNGATHVDGTRHFDPLGEWAPEIPLEPFYADAVLLDVSHLKPVRFTRLPSGAHWTRRISATSVREISWTAVSRRSRASSSVRPCWTVRSINGTQHSTWSGYVASCSPPWAVRSCRRQSKWTNSASSLAMPYPGYTGCRQSGQTRWTAGPDIGTSLFPAVPFAPVHVGPVCGW
jgi:hypothetical protein